MTKTNQQQQKLILSDMVRLRHTNSNPKMKGWQYNVAKVKEDSEKAESIILPNGVKELSINADTHSKIVLRNETIKQLISYAKRGNDYVNTESTFDEIIQSLLKRYQKSKPMS
jgi:hypothetical protein